MGVIKPSANLNATFSTKVPRPGHITFLSQSGALGTAVLDWAVSNNIGFSSFVSLGSMLDVDFGSYPFVTSSNTICAGACTGLGIAPNSIGNVYGIFKAYCTRVGSGPFPTELFDETGQSMRDNGHEYGSVTGRPRRCGWIDLVSLRYAIMINGVTDLIMMKSDVMDSFETIKTCFAYKINGKVTESFPFDINDGVEPVFTELPGWQTDMTKMQSEDEFPEEFNNYLSFLEDELNVRIKIVSVGPDREQTIERYIQ